MPSGSVYLKVKESQKVTTLTKIEKLLKSTKKEKIIKIQAENLLEDSPYWRPKGENFYQLKVIEIKDYEPLEYQEKQTDFPKFNHRIICQLIGMNGEVDKYPQYFCYPSGGLKNSVMLLCGDELTYLQYSEYLTL